MSAATPEEEGDLRVQADERGRINVAQRQPRAAVEEVRFIPGAAGAEEAGDVEQSFDCHQGDGNPQVEGGKVGRFNGACGTLCNMRRGRWGAALVLFVLVGCHDAGEQRQELPEPPRAELGGLLAAADRADGVEDKVVFRCAVCGLGMDGSPEMSSTFQGFTFYHCSPHCRELFNRDPGKVLARLDVPSAGEAARGLPTH